ncbi:MAG: histidine phosphatase family protein [Planctomycetes bacterium]|nr:histidine phosphatase family protein [Planctomycetota bacterium]
MLTVLLIRTGATEYDCQGRVQGTLDVPLSEDGRQQIEEVARQLADQEVAVIYAGPCGATLQSAEIVAKQLHGKVKTVVKLCNLNHGLWQGMLIDDVKMKQPKVYKQWQEHPETVCPPDGESVQVVRERLQEVLAKISKKHKKGTVAIVAPEPLASVLRNILRDDALGDLWRVEDQNQPIWELIDVPEEVVSS